jgi:hypothetical protein
MNQTPCDTCAFGKAGAALEPHNHLKALICSLAPRPFACHHTRDGREIDWHSGMAILSFVFLPRNQRRICAGWQREVAKRAKAGYFKGPYKNIRRAVADAALEELVVFTDRKTSRTQKARAETKLRRMMRFLCRQDIGPLRIPL